MACANPGDWEILNEFIYGDAYKLREATSAHWKTGGGTNETGFSALAANRAFLGAIESTWTFGDYASFWTSTGTLDTPISLYFDTSGGLHYLNEYSGRGRNIRCVKND